VKKRIDSFRNAFRGIRMVFRSEKNMQIHLIFVILVLFFGVIFVLSAVEWMICLLCFGLVIGAEMMNTAVETLVDLVSPQKQKLAGKAKDVAAGAVLVAAIATAITGLIIFVPKAWNMLKEIVSYFME
jgi:diacylglycerol kinase (ATP)